MVQWYYSINIDYNCCWSEAEHSRRWLMTESKLNAIVSCTIPPTPSTLDRLKSTFSNRYRLPCC